MRRMAGTIAALSMLGSTLSCARDKSAYLSPAVGESVVTLAASTVAAPHPPRRECLPPPTGAVTNEDAPALRGGHGDVSLGDWAEARGVNRARAGA